MTTAGERDRQAAEYALGSLDAVERAEVTVRMAADIDLRRSIGKWHVRLGGLAHAVSPVAPPPETWQRIAAALSPPAPEGEGGQQQQERRAPEAAAGPEAAPRADLPADVPAEPAPPPRRRVPVPEPVPPEPVPVRRPRGRFWRIWGILATLLALALVAFIAAQYFAPFAELPRIPGLSPNSAAEPASASVGTAAPVEPGQRFVAVLEDQARQPGFLVAIDVGAAQFAARPVRVDWQPGQSLELWLVLGGGRPPRSLGLLEPGRTVTDALTNRLSEEAELPDGAVLAVSVEPEGGSPSGRPTGRVVFSGPLLEAPL